MSRRSIALGTRVISALRPSTLSATLRLYSRNVTWPDDKGLVEGLLRDPDCIAIPVKDDGEDGKDFDEYVEEYAAKEDLREVKDNPINSVSHLGAHTDYPGATSRFFVLDAKSGNKEVSTFWIEPEDIVKRLSEDEKTYLMQEAFYIEGGPEDGLRGPFAILFEEDGVFKFHYSSRFKFFIDKDMVSDSEEAKSAFDRFAEIVAEEEKKAESYAMETDDKIIMKGNVIHGRKGIENPFLYDLLPEREIRTRGYFKLSEGESKSAAERPANLGALR